jgi:hypothetical protein
MMGVQTPELSVAMLSMLLRAIMNRIITFRPPTPSPTPDALTAITLLTLPFCTDATRAREADRRH